jgi:ADP-ribose pyrophosphatase
MAGKSVYKTRLYDIEEIYPKFNNKKIKFYRIKSKESSVIIPFVDGKFVLEKQYRPVVGKHIIEFPAGGIEKSETPIQNAKKELLEETGYVAKNIKHIFTAYSSPGMLTEKCHFFYAYNLKKEKQHLEPDENIKVMLVSPKKALQMVRDNEIEDLKTIVGIMLFAKLKL